MHLRGSLESPEHGDSCPKPQFCMELAPSQSSAWSSVRQGYLCMCVPELSSTNSGELVFSVAPGKFSCVFQRLYTMIFPHLRSGRKGEALSAPPCASAGPLVPVPLCSGSFPEGRRWELSLSCVDEKCWWQSCGW